ncbi:MAG: class I SAM-dependent methyltransferase [Planctomycetes bacterium]|nr:class I SAM-dependent methyltransferase [Planctomycetota bacterium]
MLAKLYPSNYYCHNSALIANDLSFLGKFKKSINARIGFPKIIRSLMKSLSSEQSSSVSLLDIGCGNGAALDMFKKYAPVPITTTGLDFNEQALKIVASKGHAILCGRLESIVLPAESFDIIYSSNVIEHISDPLLMIRQAAHALKPKGIFLCETPNYNSIDARLFSTSGHWGGFHFPRHWTFFTDKTFILMAEKGGFEVMRIDYQPVPIFWIWTLHSFVYRGKGKRDQADSFFPLFEKQDNFKKIFFLKVIFTVIDLLLKLFTGKTSLMSVTLRKK